MSSKKRSRKIIFRDERSKSIVEEWTTKQGWQIDDFATFLSLVRVSLPIEINCLDDETVNTIIGHQIDLNEDVLIHLVLETTNEKPSTITVSKSKKAEIYEVIHKSDRNTTPKVDIRYITFNDGVKKIVFLLYHQLPYAVKCIEGKEEVSISRLSKRWKYKNETMEIVFNIHTRKYSITLQGEEGDIKDVDLLELIRKARKKVSNLNHLTI